VKDHLLQLLADKAPDERKNLGREYLQLYMLRLIAEAGLFPSLEFVGGTALRVLFALPRFSEDLDFSSREGVADAFDAKDVFSRLKRALEASGYEVEVKASTTRPVVSAFYRFPGLPAEAGWTRDRRVKLGIKVEIDRRSPAGAEVETTLVQRFFPIAVAHHDVPSLFAGKLHALLSRGFTKGRDWYDLIWYLTVHQGLEPNAALLQNALRQSGHEELITRGWREALRQLMVDLDWDIVVQDVRPFLQRQSDLQQLNKSLLAKLLRG